MQLKFLQLAFLLILFCVGCSASLNSRFHFTGDGTKLLIESSDLPPQWQLETIGEQPLNEAKGWVRIYSNSDTHERGIVSHGITVFNSETDAIEYWNEFVKMEKDFPRPPCVSPPSEYVSDFADQFEVFCADSESFMGVFAYEYSVVARYGNVVSTLWAVTVNEPNITIFQASEAGVLRWIELKALLEHIDEKFQEVNSITE